MEHTPDYLNRRIYSAVWGTAAAVALLVTWALPWARTPDTTGVPPADYYTLWHLSERSYNDLATPTRILLVVMLIAVIAVLAAAAKATGASYLGAGVVAAITVVGEIYVWTRTGPVIGQAASGVVAATLLTFTIMVVHLVVGFVWIRSDRHS
jgi:hypothetical protein